MTDTIPVVKDEDQQQLVPTVWRPAIECIVSALCSGDFLLASCLGSIREIAQDKALRLADGIESYGATLIPLPNAAWDTSACQWKINYWEVLVDLYTVEEGASDLALSLRVYEVGRDYEFEVLSVHVP